MVTLRPKPGQAHLLSDLNLDGYVAWVHVGANAWPKPVWPTYNLYINRYLVFENVTPDDTLTSVYFVMFGDTALRCQSLSDDQNPFKAGILEPGSSTPIKLLNRVLPARKKTLPTSSPQYGVPIPAHDDLLGYFIFNWDNQFNPTSFDNDTQLNLSHQYTQGQWSTLHALPKLLKGLQFSTPTACPLKAAAPNNVTLHVVKNISTMGYQGPGDFLIAEFYDRKQLRMASQSWHDEQGAGQTVVVNDHPLYWGDGIDAIGNPDLGLDFDLTPRKDYSKLTVPPALLGAYDTNTSSSIVPPIDAAYQAALHAYEALVAAYNAECTTLLNAITPLINTYTADASNIFNLSYLIKQNTANPSGWPGGVGSMETNSTIVVNALNAAQGELTGAIVGFSLTQLAAFSASVAAVATPYAAMIADVSQAGLFYNATLLANKPEADALPGDASAIVAAATAYINYAVSNAPIAPPDSGNYAGLSLDDFRYRKITVGAGGWEFDDWTKAPFVR